MVYYGWASRQVFDDLQQTTCYWLHKNGEKVRVCYVTTIPKYTGNQPDMHFVGIVRKYLKPFYHTIK